jgi:hypothetical protein
MGQARPQPARAKGAAYIDIVPRDNVYLSSPPDLHAVLSGGGKQQGIGPGTLIWAVYTIGWSLALHKDANNRDWYMMCRIVYVQAPQCNTPQVKVTEGVMHATI